MLLWILYLSALSFFSPTLPEKGPKAPSGLCEKKPAPGVHGTIRFFSGNQMPSPEGKPKTGNGVRREIGIFQVLKLDQTVAGKNPGFYSSIKGRRIRKAWSNARGCFAFHLPPGQYSMLVREKGAWYANSFGPNNEINPIEVRSGESTSVEFSINYAAFF
jgi:hypothetical protein